ncbi:DNA polymerase III subunit gamma/tau [Pseudoclavibacter triregionum]|nr:DNA polymerase III subunit gamma/tau [Pseudoclavibacter triregionum]
MTVWDELSGQHEAVEVFRRAVAASRPGAADPSGMTNSWLITGPAGSGRSNSAYAFAAGLLCPSGGCGECESCRQVAARSHPDLTAVVTETVLLDIKTARGLVERASMSPMNAPYRVIVVEDADRMVARTSNTLLKAIEEPPASTVWILCAPSEADLLPTIRSRVRTVSLRMPSVDDVAELLVRRDGVPRQLAERAAREAQSHIGMARRLATSPEARERRERALDGVLGLGGVGDAVRKAAEWVEIAQADGEAQSADRDEAERTELLRTMGVALGKAVPRQLRAQVKDLEDHQKRRAKRAHVDGVDRILTDVQSLLRDLLTVQLRMDAPLVNEERRAELESAAGRTSAESTLTSMDAIATTRARLGANVPPALALEALAIQLAR